VKNIVTGATGFLGANLVRSLLLAHEQVLVISRDGWRRCEQLFEKGAEGLEVISSDLFGLTEVTPIDKSWYGATFWHLAANLQFGERYRQDIFDTNVNGTQIAIEFASRFGCEKFIYVSTAYTTGRSTGLIQENLHQPKGFNNVYEESKNTAEQLVVELCPLYDMKFIIARPSIIVGNSISYDSSGSESGLYGFALRVNILSKVLRDFGEPLRLLGDPNALLDFCPVDHVVDDLLELQTIDNWNKPYHLTNGGHLTVAAAMKVITDIYNIPGIKVVAQEFNDYNRFEKVLARQMSFYSSYLSGNKEFVRTLSPRRPVTLKDISKYINSFKELQDKHSLNDDLALHVY
jgi:nucleoside-diphosphate-sugar epimerase